MLDALWHVMSTSNIPIQDMLIFLPSRRAIRSVEKMIVQKNGGAVILPELVALGEGVEEFETEDVPDTISNTERVVMLAKILSTDRHIKNISTALPIARDLIKMVDNLETCGTDVSQINWADIVDEKYATHFQDKAKILQILSDNNFAISCERQTVSAKRNADIRAWIPYIESPKCKYKMVIVCGSTASVPATADLMTAVANTPFGRVILSGKISGRKIDFELPTNPYHSEYKFLSRIGYDIGDIVQIDVGDSATIDFMNFAFGNETTKPKNSNAVKHCHLIECERESVEAAATAEIVSNALKDKRSVLIITPDAAGNQRIASELTKRNIPADFSGGMPGTMHTVGRAILNMFDDWIENNSKLFDKIYSDSNNNLFETILRIVDSNTYDFIPKFNPINRDTLPIWNAIRETSNALSKNNITLTTADARAFIADALSGVTIRQSIDDDTHVCVLGTIESRMQTADVVILTGLNDGMFPSNGYTNAWLPRTIAEQIGLVPPEHKVSLMALDFMNMSCGPTVYWLRSKTSGGVQTTESRFISRVTARGGKFDTKTQNEILSKLQSYDNVERRPLNYAAPTPPKTWDDIYVTNLEYLIHNPYTFYVRNILKLKQQDDYWIGPDARKFGTLVHDVIEHAKRGDTAETLVKRMDDTAKNIPGLNGVQIRFWHKRFCEIAPIIVNEIESRPNALAETSGSVVIDGHNIRARADRIDDGVVIDIKTGSAPTKTQLMSGTMPQLPLEAYMLQSGGFKMKTTTVSKTPIMIFLQLRNNDPQPIVYDAETTQQMIDAAVAKTKEMIDIFCVGRAAYENRPNSDKKYRQFDDLARAYDDL